jgi:hypothetical protein
MRRGRSFARAEARNAIRARNRARGAGDSITSSCGRLRAQGVALGDCMVRTIGSRPGAVGRLLSGLPQAHGGPSLAGLIPSRLTALCQEPQRGGDTSARGSAPGGSWRPSEEDGNNVSLPPPRESVDFLRVRCSRTLQGALFSCRDGRNVHGTSQAEACGYRRSTVLGKEHTSVQIHAGRGY